MRIIFNCGFHCCYFEAVREHTHRRGRTMLFLAFPATVAGLCYTYSQPYYRLIGRAENKCEVKKYGAESNYKYVPIVSQTPRSDYLKRIGLATDEQIEKSYEDEKAKYDEFISKYSIHPKPSTREYYEPSASAAGFKRYVENHPLDASGAKRLDSMMRFLTRGEGKYQ